MSVDAGPPHLPGIPGSEPSQGAPRVPLRVQLAAAVLLAVVIAVVAIGFVAEIADAHHGSRAGGIVGTAVCFALFYACTRWTIRLEHRLRAHTPVAQAFAATAQPTATTRRRPARRRAYSPRAMVIITVVFALIGIGFGVGAFFAHRASARSSYVQAHGVRAAGTVDSVDNTQVCGRYSCDWESSIVVSLSASVDGVTKTTVHYPDYSDLVAGDPVVVLVDPQQPSYAELPGSKDDEPIQWIILAVFALLGLVLTVFEARALYRVLEHRRQQPQGTITPASPEPEPDQPEQAPVGG